MPVEVRVETRESLAGLPLDLLLDVGIRCNSLTQPVAAGIGPACRVSTAILPRTIGLCNLATGLRSDLSWLGRETDAMLGSFVQDFFRKHALRPGQATILRNVFAQRATIGLLPNSTGDALCYQLAALSDTWHNDRG